MSWTHLEDSRPRAAKAHRCYLCGLPIAAGEIHIKRSGTTRDVFVSFRMHVACERLTHDWDYEWCGHDPVEFRFYLDMNAAERNDAR